MGRDKKKKPKKTDKYKEERQERRNKIELQRQEEVNDTLQHALRFLSFSSPVQYSRDDVFKALYDQALKIIKEKNLKNYQVRRDQNSSRPHQEIPEDQPGPSGIDYERERRERRLPRVQQDVSSGKENRERDEEEKDEEEPSSSSSGPK